MSGAQWRRHSHLLHPLSLESVKEWRKQSDEGMAETIACSFSVVGECTGVLLKEGSCMLQGLIHISELSWNRIFTPEAVVRTGDIVRCLVVSTDPAAGKIFLSLKVATALPFLHPICVHTLPSISCMGPRRRFLPCIMVWPVAS